MQNHCPSYCTFISQPLLYVKLSLRDSKPLKLLSCIFVQIIQCHSCVHRRILSFFLNSLLSLFTIRVGPIYRHTFFFWFYANCFFFFCGFVLALCCTYSLSLLLPPFYCVPSPSYPSLLYHALTTSIIFSTHLVLYWWNVSIAAFMQHFIASENLVLISSFFDNLMLVKEISSL